MAEPNAPCPGVSEANFRTGGIPASRRLANRGPSQNATFGRARRLTFNLPSPDVHVRHSFATALAFSIAITALPMHAQTSSGAAVTGRYRNLFVEAGHTPAEVSARIEKTFQQLFHGDSATQTVYYAAGKNANGPLAYVTDIINHDVRSEGMSYGMMIAVQLDKKPEFDALWNWSKTYMYHDDPKHPSFGFFSWSMKTNGTPNSESPAPDGEEYFAMALYFASARWGDGEGIYDYRAAADRLLTDMRNRVLISGRESNGRTETEYAEFNPEH